ncbi:MAG: DNA internalization-related competence protein ComEC/Rec2 [Nevskia sp.]|nr:DNA internalization-related competence protein ComEC/Rec2 [Nevskia sp.]
MRRPPEPETSDGGLLPVVLLFTAGALAVLALPALPPLSWLAALAVPALLPWRWRRLYAVALLGALLTVLRVQHLLDTRWPLADSDRELTVQGRIASLPQKRLSPGQHEEAELSDVAEADGPKRDLHFLFAPDDAGLPLIRVSWYRSDQAVRGGDCWRLRLRLRAPHGSLNPSGYDYEAWLFEQGIGATATVRAAEPCAAGGGYLLLRARQAVADRLEHWLPGDPALGLVAGLAVGDRALLREPDWDTFRVTGTSHLMAIAGLHIGMVVAAVYFVLRWLWVLFPSLCLRLPAQKAGMLGAVLAAVVYALMSGFEPPAQRALLMLLFGFAALWTDRASQVGRALALAWLLIVAASPTALLSPGLWLSFTAVAAILYVLSGRLQARHGLRSLLLLQLTLSLVLLPLTFYFFQGGGWLGPLANLAVVPAFTVLLPLLLVALLLSWAWPAAGVPLLHFVAHGILWVREGLGWAAEHAPQAWIAASPEPALLLLAMLGMVFLLAPRGVPLRGFAALCFLPLFLPLDRAPREGFDLTALDVGQGLSVVVRTAHHTLLFDTGPAFEDVADAGRSEVVPFLLGQGVSELDMMIVSQADLDHRGGAPSVRRSLQVLREIGALSPLPCVEGQRWDWDGVTFQILNPPAQSDADPPHSQRWSRNNGGCVLRVSSGGHAALLPADIEAPAEKRLLAGDPGLLRADVVLAPHHGSKTSSTQGLVDAAQPLLVIFPSGWHNRFRFPRAPVVARYLLAGAEPHMTGNGGAVSVHVGADGVGAAHDWSEEHPRLWRAAAEAVPTDLD